MRTKLWRTISAIKSEVRCQLLLSVFNTKSLQCDSDWFNVIQTDSMWFSRFSMTQQIQYDSMDSEWISLIRNDSVWLNVILAACGESRVRQCSRTSLHMQTSALIKCWGKAWFDFSDFFCWNAPRKRSRTRGCLSQKLFTYGKVNFGELLRCDIPQSRVFTLAGNFARRLTYPVCAAHAPIGAARLDYI